MPSFDVVSEVDMHEVTNAVGQANREVHMRFDFKGSNSSSERDDAEIHLRSESDGERLRPKVYAASGAFEWALTQ